MDELEAAFQALTLTPLPHPVAVLIAKRAQKKNLKAKWTEFFNNNRDEDWWNDLKLCYYYTYKFTNDVINLNKMQYQGCLATLTRPTVSSLYKVLVIFFAPSNDTAVGNEENPFDWNPFINENTRNYVRTFLHLDNHIPGIFKKLYLLDMFPHRIWEQDLEIEEDDILLAKLWITNQILILNPDYIFIANKTWWKKLVSFGLKIEKKVNLISHPGYCNRNTNLVVSEWKMVERCLNKNQNLF